MRFGNGPWRFPELEPGGELRSDLIRIRLQQGDESGKIQVRRQDGASTDTSEQTLSIGHLELVSRHVQQGVEGLTLLREITRTLGQELVRGGWRRERVVVMPAPITSQTGFGDATGNFYDGGFVQDINADLEKDSGQGPDDHSDLRALQAACLEPDPEKRWPAIEERLDVDAFVSFMALELMTCHWDGYTPT